MPKICPREINRGVENGNSLMRQKTSYRENIKRGNLKETNNIEMSLKTRMEQSMEMNWRRVDNSNFCPYYKYKYKNDFARDN